ncbi:GDSL-type esterase/lipase family protein [Pseudoramibacter sp.]|jgi:lysophospholipase L1-like esterase|uniref:GDSL-type esterase/lipase family protein n=1 Tax=Pseudoramibacter sp. TaxID=2034862 RepID=UPI0025E8B40E|nr:GDSL-type esterase/lipase family protein [Pseudoramibacter sp.]MCH4072547.1 GDSL-type esterase/lipase family protein [Pseudoramibacter sp.]MCH4106318.1 GDSL-type esterase/lipase family protein [Pseudoramibacter sp.]
MKKIICYGDSNTYGYDPRNGGGDRYDEVHRWPEVMEAALNEKGGGVQVVNSGFPGRTLSTVLFPDYYGNGVDLFTTSMRGQAPFDWLFVMLGSNDCLRPDSVEQITARMAELIRKAKSASWWRANPQILLMAPPQIGKMTDQRSDDYLSGYCAALGENTLAGFFKKSKALRAAYRKLAEKERIPFFDAGEIVQGCSVDYIHLTEDSQRVLGQAMARYAQTVI